MSRSLALGWRRDPVDARDQDALKDTRFSLHAAPAVIPGAARNADLVMVVDQLQEGSCTTNSTGQAVRAAQILEMVEAGTMTLEEAQTTLEFWSRDFPYYLARAYDHTTTEDAGTNIRTVFQAINKFGFCPNSVWPYLGNTDRKVGPVVFDKMPSAEAFRQAYDQRASADNANANVIDYARITGSGQARIDAIKLASSQRHLIVFGTEVTEEFCSDMTANGGRPIDPPTLSASIAGGHALCIGGYDSSGAEVINSWSEEYGGRGGLPPGWCKFSWNYITWEDTTDFWIVRRAPILAKAA